MPVFHNPLTAKFRLATVIALLLLLAYLGLCFWIFVAWARPETEGVGHIRLGADSATYYALGELADQRGGLGVPLLSLTQNLIGPLSLILLLKTASSIALFNLLLFLIALAVASSIEGVRFHVFTLLVICDAETMSALTTVNKEIFALFSVVLFAKYLEGRSKWMLLLVLLSSIMARWEQAAIIIFFLFAEKAFRHRGHALILLVALMTIAAPVVYSHVDPESYAAYTEGGRTMLVFDAIQSHFGYFLVVAPKALMNLMGNVAAPWTYAPLWAHGFDDAQNQLLIRAHEMAMTC